MGVFDLVLTENVGYCLIGHSKQREVLHSTTIREGSSVEMSYKKCHWEWLYIIMCLYVFRDAKMVYPLQYREMYSHV